MFTEISIKNFRSFGVGDKAGNRVIKLGSLTCVVGANSSGKSNVIRALQFATTPDVSSMQRTDFYIGVYAGKERKSGSIEIELKADLAGVGHQIKCVGRGTDKNGFSKVFEINGVEYPPVSLAAPATQELAAALEPFSVFVAPTIRDVDYLNSALDLLPVATRSSVLQSTNGLRAKLEERLASVCKELKIPLGVSGVSVSPSFTLETLLSNVRLNFDVRDGVSLPISNLGQGHISQAILKLAQMRGGASVTCIEEPEIHVHPSGIKGLVKTIRAATKFPGQQVIFTTHSPEVVNQTDFNELVCVKKAGQRSIVAQIDPAVVGANLGGAIQHRVFRQDQRGILFLAKKVLLVEGPYDRLIVEAIDKDGLIGLIESDVSVVEMGGKGQIKTYHTLLQKLSRPHAILLDSDMVFESPAKSGPLESALLESGILAAAFPVTQIERLARAAPSSFRTQCAELSKQFLSKGLTFAAHGHHDISDALKECALAADRALKISAYRNLGGTMPVPTDAVMDAMFEGKASSKNVQMIDLVNSFPPSVFGRIARQIKRAIVEVG